MTAAIDRLGSGPVAPASVVCERLAWKAARASVASERLAWKALL